MGGYAGLISSAISLTTSCASRPSTLTASSSMGVFEKRSDDRTFTLTRVFADPAGSGIAETVQKIRAACGWPLQAADPLEKVAPPTVDELRLLRIFYPKGYYLK
jgi:hypothetical protein